MTGRSQSRDGYNYDGFVSYRTLDNSDFAPKIQDGLEQLAKPWNKRKALKIFQDIDDLAASPDLDAALHTIFDESRTLVFLASPGAAESQWCNDEVQHWIRTRPPEQLVVVLTDGKLEFDVTAEFPVDFAKSTSAPPAFAELTSMPLYIDMTPERQRVGQLDFRRDSEFRLHLTKVAARLHANKTGEEIEPRDIDSLDRTEFLKARRLRHLAIIALTVLTLLAVVAAIVAEVQRRDAEQGRRTALSKQLAGQSISISDGQLDLGSLLAAEAYHVEQTPEAFGSLITAADRSSDVHRLLRGDDRPIWNVVFDADGSLMASAGLGGAITLWAGPTLEQIGLPLLPTGSDPDTPLTLRGLAFSPTQPLIAASDSDGRVHRWDLSDLTAIVELPVLETDFLDKRSVSAIAFTPDGAHLVAAGGLGPDGGCDVKGESNIVIWALDPGTVSVLGAIDGCVLDLDVSPTQPLLASAHYDGTVQLWDVDIGIGADALLHSYPAHQGKPAQAVDFSQDGSRLASAGWDNTAKVWDVVAPFDLKSTFTGHDDKVRSVAFSRDGTTVASGDRAGRVELWNPDTGRTTEHLTTQHAAEVRTVAFHPHGSLLASAGSDDKIVIWELEPDSRRSMSSPLHPGNVLAIVFDAPRGQLISAGTAEIGPLGTKTPGTLWSSRNADDPVTTEHVISALAIDPVNDILVSGDAGGRVMLWALGQLSGSPPDIATPDCDGYGTPDVARTRERTIRSLAVSASSAGSGDSPSTEWLAIGFFGGTILVTDEPLGEGEQTMCVEGEGAVFDLTFHPTRNLLAAAAGRGRVLLWDLDSGTKQWVATASEDVQSLAFNPRGDQLAVGGSDGDIVIIDPSSGAPIGQPLRGDDASVQDLAFSSDGAILASATLGASSAPGGSITLWGVATRTHLAEPIVVPDGQVAAITWTTDRTTLVTGARKATRLWDFRPAQLRTIVCAAADRNLTDDEWAAFIGSDRTRRATCVESTTEQPAS